jgi:S-adenosylmethionine decarboxylase
MRVFAGPFAWPPDRWTNSEVELHDWNAFVAWTESGCQVYAWKSVKFVTVDVYSCKPYDAEKVVAFTREYFGSDDLVSVGI